MIYKGYEVFEEENIIKVLNVKNFDLKHTFECGQCFRWYIEEDKSYTGVANQKVINVQILDNTLYIYNTNIEDFKNIWFHYFDLGRDYDSIKNKLKKDKIVKKAIDYGWGIRILNQDPWETLISFIISTNNNIPRIKKNIYDLSKEIGNKILYKGKAYYTFPTAKELSEANPEKINICKAGYRCLYIKNTAKMINEDKVRLSELMRLSTEDAIAVLSTLMGVGKKVASCVLLFSGIKEDVFPVDVWVRKIVEEEFLKRKATLQEINKFADKTFGDLKGFAQQYLFYYFRENS